MTSRRDAATSLPELAQKRGMSEGKFMDRMKLHRQAENYVLYNSITSGNRGSSSGNPYDEATFKMT